MLVRCIADDGNRRVCVERINDEPAVTREIPYLTVGAVYRPLGMSVRAATSRAIDTYYLVMTDARPVSITFHAARLFEVMDPAIEPGWEVIHQLDHLFMSGVPELQDLEGLHDRLLAEDPETEANIRRYSRLPAI